MEILFYIFFAPIVVIVGTFSALVIVGVLLELLKHLGEDAE